MADQGRWFKLWVSAPSDPDLANLSLEDFGRWCLFGAYLKLHGEDGRLMIKGPGQALQTLFRVPSFEAVVQVLRSFPNCKLSGIGVTPTTSLPSDAVVSVEWSNWQKYQIDDSSSRVRKWREKQRGLVTLDSVSPVTPIEEKRREEKRREKKREKLVLSDETQPAPTLIQFRIPTSIRGALEQAPRLGGDARIRTSRYWQALVRAHGGVDYGREILRAEAWMVANPTRAPRKNLARFLASWIGRAEPPDEEVT